MIKQGNDKVNRILYRGTDDVARATLGGDWRMPTTEDFQELVDNCSYTYKSIDGIRCYEFTANGNKLIFPFAGSYTDVQSPVYNVGRYWSKNNYAIRNGYVFAIYADRYVIGGFLRFGGCSVRAVSETQGVDLGLPSGLKWAECNLGATQPTQVGNYYSWGELSPKAVYSWTTYKFNPSGDGQTFTKYNATDGKTTLELDCECEIEKVMQGNDAIFFKPIEYTKDLSSENLSLVSACAVLDALQPVSTAQTITFSAYTTSLINASNNALAKVYDAVQKGWTIVGEGLNGYVELEYIESTGTQYIDTGVQLHRTDVVNIEFIPTTTYGNMVYFGVRSSGTWQTSEDQFYLNYNYTQGDNLILLDALYTRQTIEPYIIVGSTYNASVTKKGLNNTHNTYLGALNNIGSAGVYAYAKYLKFDIIRGGLKIIDLVPAKRMSDGAIGMIDKISGQWYGNSGTGTFIGGEPKQD